MPQPTSDISQLWHQASRAIHERMRDAFRGSCLPPMTLGLLRRLRDSPGLTVSELARQTNLAKSYVSRTTDQLEQLGYVEKRADAADQRLTRLYVTSAAGSVMAEMATTVQNVWADILADMPAEHVDALMTGLRHLLAALHASESPSASPAQPHDREGMPRHG